MLLLHRMMRLKRQMKSSNRIRRLKRQMKLLNWMMRLKMREMKQLNRI